MMRKMKMLLIVSLVAAAALVMQVSASATPPINPDADGYITILMKSPDTNNPVSGIDFELFYVGDLVETGTSINFIPAGDFVGSGVSFSDMTASKSRIVAKTLADYAQANGLHSTVKTTGSDGKARFTSLKVGLYLVVPEDLGPSSPYKNLIPFLVSVPISDEEGSAWSYVVLVYPKLETKPNQTEPSTQTTTTPPVITTSPQYTYPPYTNPPYTNPPYTYPPNTNPAYTTAPQYTTNPEYTTNPDYPTRPTEPTTNGGTLPVTNDSSPIRILIALSCLFSIVLILQLASLKKSKDKKEI